ncbi:PKD domain-containing protein [Streptomyces sp. NBC_00555]|uniref:PKD domain-containing protein n=1 Tax=Streptomyces sp. NBC_00555 TaxID=2903662 RepID=UPI0022512B9C|nr:PKD domain-containing protein [Streptomyces sp. NBC_00555]MCX5012951.1 PKD domain-containing protein [Streptomyces sp. NBC_00555]
MRPTRATVLLTAGLVTLFGAPAAAAAETPASLYVNNQDGSNCSDSGSGTQAVPYCTISAAAKAVRPGQTVQIKPGKRYDEALTIDRSGEPGKPITLVAEGRDQIGLPARVSLGESAVTVSGASHVVLRGLATSGPVRVGGSTDVELDWMDLEGDDDVVVGDASADVRLTRSEVNGVRIEGGTRGTLLGRNFIDSTTATLVTAVDAPGTVVTNNTFLLDCVAALSLSGASTGSAVFNNVIYPVDFTPCASGSAHTGIVVSESAAAGTRADSNLLVDGGTSQLNAYNWAGTAYETAATFRAATGQGAHDIVTPSAPGTIHGDQGSMAVDSGDPTAPGVLPSDNRFFPTADDPSVPNTGKDGGFIDRGARETQDDLRGVSMQLDPAWAPAGTTVTAKAFPSSTWPAALTYHYDFGDGTAPVVTKERSAAHAYGKPGDYVVNVTAVNGVGKKVSAEPQTTKVTAPGPLTAGFTATPVLPTSDSPIGNGAPLTMSFDPRPATAAPWPVTDVYVDFGDGSYDHSDHMDRAYRHTYSQPGDYTVTFTLYDSKSGTSKVSRNVRVDYAASGYVATEPFRLLDTRTTNTPVQGGYAQSVALPIGTRVLGHELSGSMASAVLNVTVTGATEDTHLSVWPAGQPRPVTSNVNVKAGGTSSNTVTVPVGADGKVAAQLNSGRASLIVDFVGYYQPNIGERFSPVTPTRVVDTRTAGGALGGGQTRTVKVAGVNGVPADATAVALNLTGTGATEQAHVIAYPDPAKRPATSNLNVEPGKDKSNQAIVPVGPNGTITLFTNSGSTHLVVDAVGYYGKDGKALFTPVVPKRLADTRTTGKLAPGATATVAGLPANAVGAVLNVTATETTGPGFLTVHGFGTPRTDASSLNTLPGLTVPNHVTTPVGDGKVSVFNSWGGSNHVITDLLGYFTQS